MLQKSVLTTRAVVCPHCRGKNLFKNGVNANGAQRYLCRDCRRSSRRRIGFSFGMKHSNTIIEYAISLASQLDPAFSSRDIATKIGEKFNLQVSNVTVLRWILKYRAPDPIFNVPCFGCLFRDRLKLSSQYCTPETCKELTDWLESLIYQEGTTSRTAKTIAAIAGVNSFDTSQ